MSSDNILISTAFTEVPLPDVIYRPDTDRYIVAWQQGGNVYSRGVLPNGTVAGGATTLANTPQHETHPRLAGDLLVWQRQNTGSGYDVYTRPLDAAGVPTGETFVIQGTAVNQQNPAIANGVNGRTQIAWQDNSIKPWDLFMAVAFYPMGQWWVGLRPLSTPTN